MDILAFSIYLVVGSVTPGPNNCTAMSYAATQGINRSLLFSLGVFFGLVGVSAISALFTNFISERMDHAGQILRVVGTIYMVWLAWIIWRSSGVPERQMDSGGRLMLNGMILQFVNVKVLLHCITLFGGFILPAYQGRPLALFGFCLILGFVVLASNILWAAGGAALSRAFTDYPRLINGILAILLLFCVASLWI